MRVRRVVVAAVVVSTFGFAGPAEAWSTKPPVKKLSPATLTQISKHPAQADDFLRFGFLKPGTMPTNLAGPDAIRTFMTFSAFFEPALPIEKAVRFVGLEPVAAKTFLAIRCKEPDLAELAPRLAKWPEVFRAIKEDFGSKYSCPPRTSDPENDIYCIAKSFHDVPMTTASESLDNLFDVASQITGDPDLQARIRTLYGIDVGFSGLGLAVRGSGDPKFKMTSENVLENADVPEYLVKNATIAGAGCRCILVAPYAGRDEAKIDPDFVWSVGTPGCTQVSRLPTDP